MSQYARTTVLTTTTALQHCAAPSDVAVYECTLHTLHYTALVASSRWQKKSYSNIDNKLWVEWVTC